MKRIYIALALASVATLAACGGSGQYVARSDTAPMSFSPVVPDYDGVTSARSSIDLLSLN